MFKDYAFDEMALGKIGVRFIAKPRLSEPRTRADRFIILWNAT